jgi:hypothetical protein
LSNICAGAPTKGENNQPRGVTICLVTLLDVRPLRRSDMRAAMLVQRDWILN